MLEKIYRSFTKNHLKEPVNLIFFVTGKCDSRCIHCFNWKALNKKRDELTLKEVEGFAKQFNNLPEVGFSGGEPLLRADLEAIISTFEKNCGTKNFGIPTNGLRPKQITKAVKDILEKHPSINLAINLSLDGTKEIHDEIRGVKGSFEKTIETYRLLAKLKRNRDFGLKIATTLSNKNLENIPTLIEFVKKNMPSVGFQTFEIMRGSPKDKGITAPTIAQLKKVKPVIFTSYKGTSFYRKNPIASKIAVSAKKFVFDKYLEMLKKKKQLIPCYVGTTNIVLTETGSLHFCELTPSIGNIRENSVGEILNGKKAESMRESIKQRRCWCVHSCFQQNNMMFTKRMWPKIATYVIKDLLSGRG